MSVENEHLRRRFPSSLRVAWLATIAGVLGAPSPAFALDPQRTVDQYVHDVWSSRDGLPEGGVLSLLQASDGYLWLGTQCCLVRFDGQRFRRFENGERGLGQYSFVRDLLEAPDGSVWAASVGGVATYAGGSFRWFDEHQGLSHPFVYALARTDSELWVGTGGAGVWSLKNDRFTPHPGYVARPDLPGKLSDLVLDRRGALWCGTDAGVVVLGDDIKQIRAGDGLPSDTVNALGVDAQGAVCAGTASGLAVFGNDAGGGVRVELPGENVSAMLEDRAGNFWVGTRRGLYRRHGVGFELMASGSVLTIAEDRSGSIWWGTPSGLERLRDGTVLTRGGSDASAEQQILNVLPRRAGGLWLLDAAGALWIAVGEERTLALPPGSIAGAGMLGMAESGSDLFIAGSRLLRYDGRTLSPVAPGDGNPGGFALVYTDGDRLLAVRTGNDGASQIFEVVGDQLRVLPIEAPLRHVQRLLRDRRGDLWISNGGTGLVRVSTRSERAFREADGLPSDTVYGLAEDARGALWVATRRGLARIVGDRVVSYAARAHAPTRSPMHLAVDKLDFLWATADDGVHRISLSDLDRAAADPRVLARSRIFTTRDGFQTSEVSWRASGQAVTSDGVIHYATARGVSEIDPARVAADTERPIVPAVVTDVLAGGEPLPIVEFAVTLANRRDTLEVRFATPELQDPDGLEFRCRLIGFEKEWRDLRAERSTYYGNLPSGTFQLELQSRRRAGSFGPSLRLLQIHALPQWYEMTSVRAVAGALLGVMAYLLYALQLRRHRRAERALNARVAERTVALEAEVAERKVAEARAVQLADELEVRVGARTAELELARLAALRSEERYALAVQGAEDGLWDWDVVAGTLYVSPRFKAIIGLAETDPVLSLGAWLELVHPDDREAFRTAITPAAARAGQIRLEFRMRHADGRALWVVCRGVFVFDDENGITRAAGSLTDITARKRAEEQLAHGASLDNLTGLPNRALFTDRLEQAMLQARRAGRAFAVLFAGVDRLGAINTSRGHAAGDHVLQTVGARLRNALREVDTVARVGSDEFAILLHDVTDGQDVLRVAQKLEAAVAQPIELDGVAMSVRVSIGVRTRSEDQSAVEDYLREAKLAMTQAKTEGGARHRVFEAGLRQDLERRLQVEAELSRALSQDELVLHYQPLISLANGQVVGLEALVRWQHPERGLLGPNHFVGVAEACGLMGPLTEWVLARACRDARVFVDRSGSTARVAVNVPPSLLSDAELPTKIAAELEKNGLPGTALSIELVETGMLETHPVVLDNLTRLRQLGVQIAVDDFGTGYSSFGYLKTLPINYLKLDRSFVQRLPDDRADLAICTALVAMARELKLVAVAEGVENERQMECLRSIGCAVAQGYYFARPLPAHACAEFLVNANRGKSFRAFAPTSTHLRIVTPPS